MNEFVFGRQPVLEILKAGQRTLHKIWLLEGTSGGIVLEIQNLARAKGIPFEFSRREHLDKRVQGHHQGVVAQVSAATFLDLTSFLESLPHPNPLPKGEGAGTPGEAKPIVIVALDEIQDPHNVGAILRSAGFFGVAGALVPKWRSAPVGETAARVSSGAIDHVPLIRVTNLAESIKELQSFGFEVIGADMDGDSIDGHPVGPRTALIFGSEGKGLRRLVRERCDKLLKIPGAGQVGSLNVSAAAAVFLYKFCRHHVGSQPT